MQVTSVQCNMINIFMLSVQQAGNCTVTDDSSRLSQQAGTCNSVPLQKLCCLLKSAITAFTTCSLFRISNISFLNKIQMLLLLIPAAEHVCRILSIIKTENGNRSCFSDGMKNCVRWWDLSVLANVSFFSDVMP